MKAFIFTTPWKCCKSIDNRSITSLVGDEEAIIDKHRPRKLRVAPEGYFSVYVGVEMQRFVIKVERASHPLFKMLLEEARSEYGYNSQAPLWLPCKVGRFYRVLRKMDDGFDVLHGHGSQKLYGSRHLFIPSRWME
ncbi:auxin-responsive protein SAUR72-like [Cucurbita pepo subsp. pepo]|uniref:auxin-responsive protein SAUR72-like n=1 Tax=Cucurbita pepo subsp. pepo TaxID=3664 RepID=UPI000C9D8F28|nr:auxin-responsive protein SAUR72-like [Cucurbita pepo subsp. pepo]